MTVSAPGPLTDRHDCAGFACGREMLDTWLTQRASGVTRLWGQVFPFASRRESQKGRPDPILLPFSCTTRTHLTCRNPTPHNATGKPLHMRSRIGQLGLLKRSRLSAWKSYDEISTRTYLVDPVLSSNTRSGSANAACTSGPLADLQTQKKGSVPFSPNQHLCSWSVRNLINKLTVRCPYQYRIRFFFE